MQKLMPQKKLKLIVEKRFNSRIEKESEYIYNSVMSSVRDTVDDLAANADYPFKTLHLGLHLSEPISNNLRATALTKNNLKYYKKVLNRIQEELKEAGYKSSLQSVQHVVALPTNGPTNRPMSIVIEILGE